MSPLVAPRIDRPDLQLADAPAGTRLGDPVPAAARAFRVLNRFVMVLATRAGLGAWISTPIGGAMVLLRVRGRRSGVVRETPLNYVIADGSIWVVAGFGQRTEWYRNLVADPRVEAWLPGRRVAGTVTEVRSPTVRRRILPALVRSPIGPALAAGLNPWRLGEDVLLERIAWVPLLRIDADEGWLDRGADDPGGHAWLWRQSLGVVASFAAWRVLRRVRHRSPVGRQ
jgi:deazaflavin-dependent oxidoreductase (nitroreductase family)